MGFLWSLAGETIKETVQISITGCEPEPPQTSQESIWDCRSELFKIHRQPRKCLGSNAVPIFTAQRYSTDSRNFPKVRIGGGVGVGGLVKIWKLKWNWWTIKEIAASWEFLTISVQLSRCFLQLYITESSQKFALYLFFNQHVFI